MVQRSQNPVGINAVMLVFCLVYIKVLPFSSFLSTVIQLHETIASSQ